MSDLRSSKVSRREDYDISKKRKFSIPIAPSDTQTLGKGWVDRMCLSLLTESHIADILLCLCGDDGSNLEGGFTGCVEDLRGGTKGRETTSIDEFL